MGYKLAFFGFSRHLPTKLLQVQHPRRAGFWCSNWNHATKRGWDLGRRRGGNGEFGNVVGVNEAHYP